MQNIPAIASIHGNFVMESKVLFQGEKGMIADIRKLNTHNLDEKLDSTVGNLIDMLEESNERLTVKLAKQSVILEKLKEMRK